MDKKIKNTSVRFSKSKFHQFSFSQFSNEHLNYSNYKGFPTLEETSSELWTGNDTKYNYFSIITQNLIDDTPMNNNSLTRLKNSFENDLDSILKLFPDSFRLVRDLEIIIHYNNYGSTFLEWKFSFFPSKLKKLNKIGGIEVLFDFLIEFEIQHFDNIFDTLNDLQLVHGDLLYDVISDEDDTEIENYFELFINKNIEFGYKLETIDYYVKMYGIKVEIIEDIINSVVNK